MTEEEAARVIAEGRKAGLSPVQALREHLKLSREALAATTGVQYELIGTLEEHPEIAASSPDATAALARFFGITDDLLFDRPAVPGSG